MTKRKKDPASLVCLILGILLIAGAIGYIVYDLLSARLSVGDNEEILAAAEKLIPSVRDAFPEERGNNTMPSLAVKGTNISAILEFLSRGAKFPVRSAWDSNAVKSIPCVHSGSIYDRTLMIGVTDRKGQVDFAEEINVGERLTLTDMEGDRYSYTVSSIKHSAKYDPDKWSEQESDLVIFVAADLSGEYTLIYCKAD